uniref:Tetraspanin n=1 Tax=Oncorhynchus kisutch TaxID=8019 RepID=A0A8C7DT97_ONCKI
SVGIMPLLRLALLAFSCLFWASGLAIFTLGVWAQVSLANYMLLSANHYPNTPLILLATGATVTAWGFLGCLGVAANLPFVLGLECCGAEAFSPMGNSSSVSLPESCCVRRKGCRNRPLPAVGGEGVAAAGIHPHGCFRKVFSFVNDNVFHIAATVLGLAFTQIGGIALACLLANRLQPRPHRPVAH